MKRYIIAGLLLLTTIGAGARDVYSLNTGWRFFTGAATDSDGAATVSLPHTATGEGHYLKELEVPGEWAGRRVFVKGYGAGEVAEVFVNGRLAGEHRGGYTAWCFEVTGQLDPGAKNYLHITVSRAAKFDVLPTAGDMNLTGGLFRDVELIVAGSSAIDPTDHASNGVAVVADKVTAKRVEGRVVVRTLGGDEVRVSVLSPLGEQVAHGSARVAGGVAGVPFAIDGPQLWHGRRAPNLYYVTAALLDDGQVVDSMMVSTGFRTIEADPSRGFLLNGESYPLRGVIVHQDRPLVGAAITTAQVEEDLDLILDMGANAVRVEGVAHHPTFYERCDALGIVVWSDFPLVGEAFLTDRAYVPIGTYLSSAHEQSLDILRQQQNHPCVAMWGVFSNLQTRDEDPLPIVARLDSLARREGPGRLTAASSNADGQINFVTDLVCWAHRFGWTEGLPSDINLWKEQFFGNWSNLRSAVSYGAGASIAHQEAAPTRPDHLGSRHPERWQTHLHETYLNSLRTDSMLWGVFVSNMFDYGARKRESGGEAGLNDLGLVTYDRKVCKDAYYLYKANWSSEPFVYIAERRWNTRPEGAQAIKIYTNQPEVELIADGVSRGVGKVENGVFVWTGLDLRRGTHTIEARVGGGGIDRLRLEVTGRQKPQL